MDGVSLSQILWSDDRETRRALWTIVAMLVPIAGVVFAPLVFRAIRFLLLEGSLREAIEECEPKGAAAQRGAAREVLRDSALRLQYEEFERRWSAAQLSDESARAPIRLLDVLEDQPLLAFGPRRALLPVLPGLFLGIGVFGALFGLIPGVTAPEAVARGGDPLALALGLALRAMAWGFAAAIAASILGRLVEGAFEARSRGLDELLARAYRAVSPGELAEFARQSQQKSLDTLARELGQFGHELNERLERGLQRIEQSSSRAASLVSQEQRGALHTVVQELSLSVRQGVDHHLAELRNALQRAVDYQSSVTNGLSEAFERMGEQARAQDQVARTLAESANALDGAARTLRSESEALDAASTPLALAVRHSEAGPMQASRESEAVAVEIARELELALRAFTQSVTRIDTTMEALRKDLRQQLATRAEAAPPTAGVPGNSAIPPLPTAPAAQGTAASMSAPSAAHPATPATPVRSPVQLPTPPAPPEPRLPPASPPIAPIAPIAATSATGPASTSPLPDRSASSLAAAARVERGPETLASDGPLGRELSASGFRVGAPRAQGPDPYERLARGSEPPSNLRALPSQERERELGDELKLSGLLGPSHPRTGTPDATKTLPARPDERADDPRGADADRDGKD